MSDWSGVMVMRQLHAPTVSELLAEVVAGDGDRAGDVVGLADAIDRLAADGDAEELASVFAPQPGQAADRYDVEQRDLGDLEPHDVATFDDPVHAWLAFREAGTCSRALVSVAAELRRTVATMRPDGDLQIPLPDTYRLDGPRREGAAARWSHLAVELRGGRQRPLRAAGRRSEPPAPSSHEPPHEPLDAVSDPQVVVEAASTVETISHALERPLPTEADATASTVLLPEPVVEAAPELPEATETPRPIPRPSDPLGKLRSRAGGLTGAHYAIAAIAVLLGFVFIRFTVDDAFITWRYGLTFVHSGHWNWNRSGPPVEAYTSFSYAVLSIIPALLRIPTELFFKLVSLGILGGYIGWVRHLQLPQRQRLVLYAVALASPVFYIQLFSGLETVAFTLLIAVLFAAVYRNGTLGRWGYAAAVLVALTRPEGVAFALVAVGWVLVIERSRKHWWGAGAVVALVGTYWIWRAQHFGWFWPNTYYVKSGQRGSLIHQLTTVLTDLLPAIAIGVLVVVVARLLGRQVERRPIVDRRQLLQDATPVVLAVLSGLVVLFLYKQSNLSMDFANRFLWQLAFPVVAVVLARPIGLLVGRDADRRTSDLWVLAAIGITAMVGVAYTPDATLKQVVVLVAIVIVAVGSTIRLALHQRAATVVAVIGLAVLLSWVPVSDMVGWAAYRYRLQNAHQAMGHVLADSNITGAIAVGDAGVLPFELNKHVIDLDGLANPAISHGTFNEDDLRRQNLQFVVSLAGTPEPGGTWLTGQGQVITNGYAVNTARFWWSQGPEFGPGYWLNFWVTPKLAKPELLKRLQAVTDRSMQENAKDDDVLLSDHLFDLPFLGGN